MPSRQFVQLQAGKNHSQEGIAYIPNLFACRGRKLSHWRGQQRTATIVRYGVLGVQCECCTITEIRSGYVGMGTINAADAFQGPAFTNTVPTSRAGIQKSKPDIKLMPSGDGRYEADSRTHSQLFGPSRRCFARRLPVATPLRIPHSPASAQSDPGCGSHHPGAP